LCRAATPGFLAAGLTCATAQAQSVEIPHIVISATGIATSADLVANSVTVITEAEIQQRQSRTLPELLTTVPGVNVVQTGGVGGATSVFLRGANPNHTKVLIDGIDVSDPALTNRIFDLGQLTTADIERVEVLRGPQSGLYGSDALGGVISITTKKGFGPAKVTAFAEGGSFGTMNQGAQVSGSQANYNYAFTVSHLRSAEVPVTPQELLLPGQVAFKNDYENWTLSTKLGADISDQLSVNFVSRYTKSQLVFTGDDFSAFPATVANEQSTQKQDQLFTRGEAVLALFDGRMRNHFGVSYSDLSRWTLDPNNTPLISTTDGQRVKVDSRSYIDLMPGHVLLLGVERENESLQTEALSAEMANTGTYAELQSEIARRFFLVANIRNDDNERFGDHATWRLASSYRLPTLETKLKASYGTGFKAPTLTQLFVDFPSFGFFANRNLQPETSTGYDYGFEQPLFDNRIVFGVTWFHNDIKDLINFNSTFTSNENIGSATTEGYETFVMFTVNEQLKLRVDYTYTKAVDNITGRELNRRPNDKASVTAFWNPLESLTLSASVVYTGSWLDVDRFGTSLVPFETEPYTVVNVAASYALNKNATLFGRIDNLFNEGYQNPIGFQNTGIGAYAGIRGTM
jgi:vitamin B12 transporter